MHFNIEYTYLDNFILQRDFINDLGSRPFSCLFGFFILIDLISLDVNKKLIM